MVYRTIGIMSGSSLDGLDIAYAIFHENAGQWNYELKETDCITYGQEWHDRLEKATGLSAKDYQLLHTEFGHFIGEKINEFIRQRNLSFAVDLVASHGHTVFHMPEKRMTAQAGDGAAIAAETRLPVVTDLRAMDIALGGQGAPIVPIGEKWLFPEYNYFLNLGGIANISVTPPSPGGEKGWGDEAAFDICPANRVLNMLASDAGKEFDEGGELARTGTVDASLLSRLNELDYYQRPFPKSLANEFGTGTVYPLIRSHCKNINDALRTYCQHIAIQIQKAISNFKNIQRPTSNLKLLATGGGAFNSFLVQQIIAKLKELNIDVIVPEKELVNFKEALIMAFIGVLRWRQEINVLSSVTGAGQDSIGGALWQGPSL